MSLIIICANAALLILKHQQTFFFATFRSANLEEVYLQTLPFLLFRIKDYLPHNVFRKDDIQPQQTGPKTNVFYWFLTNLSPFFAFHNMFRKIPLMQPKKTKMSRTKNKNKCNPVLYAHLSVKKRYNELLLGIRDINFIYIWY